VNRPGRVNKDRCPGMLDSTAPGQESANCVVVEHFRPPDRGTRVDVGPPAMLLLRAGRWYVLAVQRRLSQTDVRQQIWIWLRAERWWLLAVQGRVTQIDV